MAAITVYFDNHTFWFSNRVSSRPSNCTAAEASYNTHNLCLDFYIFSILFLMYLLISQSALLLLDDIVYIVGTVVTFGMVANNWLRYNHLIKPILNRSHQCSGRNQVS